VIHRPTRVINIFRDPIAMQRAIDEDRYVLIMRPSRWGNPFMIGARSSLWTARDPSEAVGKYEAWLKQQAELLNALHELRGKVLGCCCAPRKCHGYVLARLADVL